MYRELSGQGTAPRAIRCAIYTRKSTDEGLDQAFNSLDAQHEACAAYIASQRHEGWSQLADRYDDGGFSGGTLERPALKRLLADIAASKVDVIVLYKIDRLTRALSDFARIVEVLDRAGASFVSVTQAFNTTTSMGRLTLNVLLSFAQFEREVGAERVRDKIAASKRKGMWMGGVVPLGYRVETRKLLPVEAEAETVRLIFQLYLQLGSVRALDAELQQRGIVSRKGSGFSRGALYLMLANRIYIGEITHRGASYPGEHDGIVDRALFDEVQALLAHNRSERQRGVNFDDPSLLAGILYDSHGRRMSPNHACKGSRRYRYYASREGEESATPRLRVPAAAVEELVLGRLRGFLRDAHAIDEWLEPLGLDAVAIEAITYAARQSARASLDLSPGDQRSWLLRLVERVELGGDGVSVTIRAAGLFELAGLPTTKGVQPIVITAPGKIERRAREVRMVIAPEHATVADVDIGLIKLLVKAHAARRTLFAGGGASLAEVARAEGHDQDYFAVLVKLAFLTPEITAAILEGRQPQGLTRQRLARLRQLPMLWREQDATLGFDLCTP